MALNYNAKLELSSNHLCEKLSKEGVTEPTIQALRDADVDGDLLLVMLNDFAEFSASVPHAGDRLRIKKVVKMCMDSTTSTAKDFSDIESSDDSSDGEPVKEKECTADIDPLKDVDGSDEDMMVDELPEEECDKPAMPSKKREGQSIQPPSSKKRATKDSDATAFDVNNIRLPSTFSRRVQRAIDEDDLIDPDNRAALVREMVTHFEGIVPYPTEEQYREIARKVCDTFPSLKDKRAGEYWETFKKQLTQRFRNNRRRSMPAVSRSRSTVVVASTSAVKPPPESALGSHSMEEFEENVAALKKLFQGKTPPAQVVQELLRATRTIRDDWMTKSADISIQDILKKFPAFAQPKWVLFEFHEKMDRSMKDIIASNWKKVCGKILEEEKENISYEQEKKVLATITRNIYHKQPTLDAISFHEATVNIFQSKVMEPRLVIFEEENSISQMFIAAEGEDLLEIPSVSLTLTEGITFLMASYYVFDIQYPSVFKPTLCFFQEILMDLGAGSDKGKAKARPTRYSLYLTKLGL